MDEKQQKMKEYRACLYYLFHLEYFQRNGTIVVKVLTFRKKQKNKEQGVIPILGDLFSKKPSRPSPLPSTRAAGCLVSKNRNPERTKGLGNTLNMYRGKNIQITACCLVPIWRGGGGGAGGGRYRPAPPTPPPPARPGRAPYGEGTPWM